MKNIRFTDPRQERIYRRLLLVGPGPAAFFKDACALMADGGGLQTTPHLVAHLLREVESGLRAVLLPYGFEGPAPCPHCQNQPGSHKQEVKAILAAYGMEEAEAASEAWLRLTGWDKETGLARLAHRRALGPPRPPDEGVRRAWEDAQELLDVVLAKFETRFLEPFKLVDDLLALEAPSAADVKRLRNNVPNNPVTLGHFFDKLVNVKWLALLDKEGFFGYPPAPERDDAEGTVAFPPWPASRYLARMGKVESAQALAVDIAAKIPETENVRVYEDLADLALAVPPGLAARLTPKIATALASPHQILLPEKLGTLVVHLAAGGERQASIDLTVALLQVLPDDRERSAKEGDEERLPIPEARAHFDPWHYRRILDKTVPALTAVVGLDALSVFSQLLADALRLSSRRGEEAKPDDYSSVWRPAIENRGDRSDRDVREGLVSAVHDVAEALVRDDPSRLPMVVEALERYGWHVFERIALQMLLTHPLNDVALIRERLTRRELFDESGLRREYRRLERKHFGALRPEDQALILGWVDAGPDRDLVKRSFEAWEGRQPTEAEVALRVKGWQLDHLEPIAEALPEQWKARYADLVRQLGAPSASDFAVERMGTFAGPVSPLAVGELKAKAVEETVEYLKAWVPPDGFMAPSREGVGRALTEAVAADPVRFVASVQRFQEVHPTYVRALLEGLTRARAEHKLFEWPEVLDLCRWVLEQPRAFGGAPSGTAKHHDEDPDWSWTRKSIVRLVTSGLDKAESGIPIALREEVWAGLSPLTEDPDPTPEDEAQYGGENMDPPTLAINTVRGDAMHAVVEYALWLRRHFGDGPATEARAAKGFDEMPQVREVLERHLDPGVDPSAAIRSTYGRYLPWLILLDRAWVTANLARIFPSDLELAYLRDAAWETYIVFSQPYNDPLAVLAEEYARAIDRIGAKPERASGPGNPDEHLAEHLMVFYWRGKLGLDEAGGLLTRFYARAGADLRREAIEFVGRSLGNTKDDMEPVVVERLVALWDKRLEACRASGEFKELETFGWWFGSGKLDSDWACAQLLTTLRTTKRIDPDFLVLEKLTGLAPTKPRDVVECLQHMVDGMRQPWELHAWGDEMEKSLRAVLRTADAAAKKAAADLINVLASKGHVSFRDLLNP